MSEQPQSQRILVVDDEPDIRDLLRDILEDEGYRVEVAASAAEAREQRQRFRPDLILLDIWMPEVDGVTLLKEWSEAGQLDAPVVMMSGHGTVETAVEATRHGARDFVEKPLSTAKLLRTVQSALADAAPSAEGPSPQALEMPVGHSRRMRELRDQVRARAQMQKPLLLVAEPGPEARIWGNYYFSEWAHPVRPDVLNGGLPESGKALFVPEVGELGMEQQWSLLEYLQQAEAGVPAPLVVVSGVDAEALHGNSGLLPELAERFRDALRLPTLQQRSEDIPELLEYYATFFSDHDQLPYRHFGVAAQNRLRNRPWPGGLDELKLLVRRVLAAGGGDTIEPADLDRLEPAQTDSPRPPAAPAEQVLRLNIDLDWDLRQAREHFEREYLRRQLELCRNNVSELARKVGQERTNLYRKLKALGLHTRK